LTVMVPSIPWAHLEWRPVMLQAGVT